MTENEVADSLSPNGSVANKTGSYPKYLLPLLIVLTALALINLLISLAILKSSGAPDLPASLDSEIARENLGSFFRQAYNSRDNDKLYNWFDPLVRVKFDPQQFGRQMAELHDLFPDIRALHYGSYECSELPSGVKSCRLYFDGKTSEGKGVLLTIFVQSQSSEKYRIQGFTLTSQQ